MVRPQETKDQNEYWKPFLVVNLSWVWVMKQEKWGKNRKTGTNTYTHVLRIRSKQCHKDPGVSSSHLPSFSALWEFISWSRAIMLDWTVATASLRLCLCSLTVPLCTQAFPYSSFPKLEWQGSSAPCSNLLRSVYLQNGIKKSPEQKMVGVWKDIWVKSNICWSCSYSSLGICLWPPVQTKCCFMGSSGQK